MKQTIIFVFCLCFCLGFTGCGKKFPEGFPKVYPIDVTVTDGSTPLSDVQVIFLPLSSGSGASVGGLTDASGVLKVQTSQGAFSVDGIPAGEYVITLKDYVKMDYGKTPAEIAAMSRAEQGELEKKRQEFLKSYNYKIPEKFSAKASKPEDRSPVRYTATEGKNELKIDISQF